MVLVGMLVQLLLGVFFTPEGVIKWTHIGPSTARFLHFHYPTWFRYLTGVVEVLIGLGLLVGFWFGGLAALAALLLVIEMVMALARGQQQKLLVLAALLLVIEMVMAIASHLVRGHDPLPEAVPATVILLLALVVLALHWANLMALVR